MARGSATSNGHTLSNVFGSAEQAVLFSLDRIGIVDPASLPTSYVEPRLRIGPEMGLGSKMGTHAPIVRASVWAERFLDVAQTDYRHALIQADAGMGKTTLLCAIKLHLDGQRLPGEKCVLLKFQDATAATLSEFDPPPHTALLLDAMDEDPLAYGSAPQRLAEVLELASRFSKVIISCSTSFLRRGHSESLQSAPSYLAGPTFLNVSLLDFDNSQVEEWLGLRARSSGWSDAKLDSARSIARNLSSGSLRPLLLSSIESMVEADTDMAGVDSPESLMELAVRSWLLREEARSGVPLAELRTACILLATHIENSGRRWVSRTEMHDLSLGNPSFRLFEDTNLGMRSFLARNSAGEIGFAHRSIQELLAALASAEDLRRLYSDATAPSADLISVIESISTEMVERIKRNPRELHQLGSRQFEELVAELLSSYGWRVSLTKATRDGGYDIFGVSRDAADVEASWLIECKRYKPERKVGVELIRNLYGVKSDLRVGHAMLATTSHFTAGAMRFKDSRYDLELRDYEGILNWLNKYKPSPDGNLYLRDGELALPGGA